MGGKNFTAEIDAFMKRLEMIDVDGISMEPYCKRYLGHLLQHTKYYLSIYAEVLEKLLAHSSNKKSEIVLIDYGCGNGLLGMFAKFCGFKKVFLNDIDETFIDAAKALSAQLNLDMDGYLIGGVDQLCTQLKDERINAITGTDVIEHIYDLEKFFEAIHEMNPAMVSVFTTASNPSNYFKVRQLKKLQLKDELEGGSPNDSVLFGSEALEPFLTLRERIIRQRPANLNEPEILALARATRGKSESDIIAAIADYRTSGKMPQAAEGTNTCNPLNGSWTERILSLDTYKSLYANAGFTCRFYAGFYNDTGKGVGAFVKKLLNAAISTMGKKISPYIVIVGFKK